MAELAEAAPEKQSDVPDEMNAVRLYEYGGPEVLQRERVPTPKPGPGEVLVRVRAIAVNNWDLRWRSGHAPQVPGRPAPSLPFQLGREGSGEIVALGPGVRDRSVGERVVLLASPACGHCLYCDRGQGSLCVGVEIPGHTRFGFYAEYVAVHSADVFAVPDDGPGCDRLAPILWAYGCAQHMVNLARVGVGDVVLVTAAASAVGVAGMQLARLAGAGLVIGLTRSPDKHDGIRAAGADVVLDHRDPDAVAHVRSHCDGRVGADVVLDNYGSEELVQFAINTAGLGGRIVLAATPAKNPLVDTVAIPSAVVFMKHLSILGSRGATRGEQRHVLDLAVRGKISMPVVQTLPFEQIAAAHTAQAEAKHVGKIVLTV
jgi:NADPH:quinone reductase-like Zn-dependent oxidoreductase